MPPILLRLQPMLLLVLAAALPPSVAYGQHASATPGASGSSATQHAARKTSHPTGGKPLPSTSSRLGPPPAMPGAPPPAAIIPPPDLAPPHPTTPPPPPPVRSDAPGETNALSNGLRVTFGDQRADFNPATETAIRQISAAGKADPTVVYNLYAYAPGTAEDASTPRRLSLERALSVRSALINAGIISTRIYVHALGASKANDGPPNRVDVTLATLPGGAPGALPPSPQTPRIPSQAPQNQATAVGPGSPKP